MKSGPVAVELALHNQTLECHQNLIFDLYGSDGDAGSAAALAAAAAALAVAVDAGA